MGTKRVEGRTKKKSVKSKVTSLSSSQKKLSRMGKKSKKGLMGPSTDFMTRSSVLKRLQITLKDFRRLCILKGIYPRVPKKAPKGSDKIYYDIKDITYLSHEPLLKKFREFKIFMKKIRREAGRYQFAEARRRNNEMKPKINLDHLVKERYPRFIDALRDLDDALSMVHLFASLPSTGRVTADRTSTCNELVQHWQYYVAKTRSLSKTFVSVKGVYFQCEVLGEPITWVVPHKFTQSIPREVDVRVMTTFLEFYEVFLKFTLFKLYNMQGLRYPPQIDKGLNEAGCFLLSVKAIPIEGTVVKALETSEEESSSTKEEATAVSTAPQKRKTAKEEKLIRSLNAKIDSIASVEEDSDDEEATAAPIAGPLHDAFAGLYDTSSGAHDKDDEEKKLFTTTDDDKRTTLFSKLRVFVNREVPLDWMQLCIISFGGQVGWDDSASPFAANDAGITHHIVDRPMQGVQTTQTREYVQPQWVFDCINAQVLLPVHKYRPGSALPPHLSPFVDNEKEGYTPKYSEELARLKSSVDVRNEGSSVTTMEASPVAESDNDDEEEDEATHQATIRSEKLGKKAKTASVKEKKVAVAVKKVVEQLDEDETSNDDEDEDAVIEDVEPETNPAKGPKGIVYKPKKSDLSEDQESAELSKIMMSKKSKRLYGRIQHGIEKKKGGVQNLIEKRKLIDEADEKSSASSSAIAVAAAVAAAVAVGDAKGKANKKQKK